MEKKKKVEVKDSLQDDKKRRKNSFQDCYEYTDIKPKMKRAKEGNNTNINTNPIPIPSFISITLLNLDSEKSREIIHDIHKIQDRLNKSN